MLCRLLNQAAHSQVHRWSFTEVSSSWVKLQLKPVYDIDHWEITSKSYSLICTGQTESIILVINLGAFDQKSKSEAKERIILVDSDSNFNQRSLISKTICPIPCLL